jgi:hypothetical protein
MPNLNEGKILRNRSPERPVILKSDIPVITDTFIILSLNCDTC